VHAVLCVQHKGVPVIPFEERPIHPQVSQLLILDHRPQLFVISKQNHLEAQQGLPLHSHTQRHPSPSAISNPPQHSPSKPPRSPEQATPRGTGLGHQFLSTVPHLLGL
jgi:hypothetical protein